MEVYKKEIRLGEELPSTAGIFKMIQDVSAEHCEGCGMGMDRLGKMGIIWVVIRQSLSFARPFRAGELIELSTWPGPTRHMMFPRYYSFRAEDGELIMRAGAIWTLVSMESRKMINPESRGLGLEGLVTGEELKISAPARRSEYEHSGSFTVPPEYLDSNRHMNNTRYYDMCESLMGISGRHIRQARTDYISEARLGDSLSLHWHEGGEGFSAEAEKDGPIFKTELIYF